MRLLCGVVLLELLQLSRTLVTTTTTTATAAGGITVEGMLESSTGERRRYTCPARFIRMGNSCYFLSSMMASWHDAHFQCRAMAAHLAAFEKRWEDRNMRRYLQREEMAPLARWIGGIYQSRLRRWLWGSSGQPIGYTSFPRRSVTQDWSWHCLSLDPTRKYNWRARSCLERKHYICETPLRKGHRRKPNGQGQRRNKPEVQGHRRNRPVPEAQGHRRTNKLDANGYRRMHNKPEVEGQKRMKKLQVLGHRRIQTSDGSGMSRSQPLKSSACVSTPSAHLLATPQIIDVSLESHRPWVSRARVAAAPGGLRAGGNDKRTPASPRGPHDAGAARPSPPAPSVVAVPSDNNDLSNDVSTFNWKKR